MESETSFKGAVAVELREVSKRFDAVLAVQKVSFSVKPGEIVALLGENGAGKSTLVKMVAGLVSVDSGEIRIGDRGFSRINPKLARQLGIGLVQQELSFAPDLTVAENLFLGTNTPTHAGFLNYREIGRQAELILREVGVKSSPFRFMRSLTLAEAQLVELAKQLMRQPNILILDEATSALSAEEAEIVYGHAKRMAKNGVAVLLITHRLAELRHANRAVVLRDGQFVGDLQGDSLEADRAINLMLGRELKTVFPERLPLPSHVESNAILSVENLDLGGRSSLSFMAQKGEILGIGGLAGHGQHELFRWIFGLENFKGLLKINGRSVRLKSPVNAIRAGLAYVPEERKTEALLVDLALKYNVTLPGMLDKFTHWGMLRIGVLESAVDRARDRFRIKASRSNVLIRQLSGGNQQKVAIARWWLRGPEVYLLEDPTRGIDVGSKHEIYQLLQELVQGGATVLITSSDTLEFVHLCDRVVVLYEREIIGEYMAQELTEERLVRAFVSGRVS